MKKNLLFVVMVFSVNYLYAYDYFKQSVAILTSDVTTGKSLFYSNATFKIGINESQFYISLDNGSTAEAITFYVDNVNQADNKGIVFGSSYAYDYLSMKRAKQNTFRGASVGLVPVEVDISKFDKDLQGTEEIVCIGFLHDQTKTEQKYFVLFKESSSPYYDVLQAFIKAYNNKNNSTNTSTNTSQSSVHTQQSPKTDSKGSNVHSEKSNVLRVETNGSYVDLGLPSGTLWKDRNECIKTSDSDISFFVYNGDYKGEPMYEYVGGEVPTIEQWNELWKECTFVKSGHNYVVKGKNGKSIVLQATGIFNINTQETYAEGNIGSYWSSTALKGGYKEKMAYYFCFLLGDNSLVRHIGAVQWNNGIMLPVRLVKKK